MPRKLRQDHEIVAAHIMATTAAFQVLVRCLQENGVLKQGQMSEALLLYMAMAEYQKCNEIQLALLQDLRLALMD